MIILEESSPVWQSLNESLVEVFKRGLAAFRPPLAMSTAAWAAKFRWIAPEQSAHPGKYDIMLTPWVAGILEALDAPNIREVVCMKSAQCAWTDGVWNNYLGKRIHLDPCPIVLLFPKDGTIKKYLRQKLVPMVRVTPVLRDLVDVSATRSAVNTQDYKEFPGGFLALVGSNAPDNVKTLSAPVICIEEPDDCNTDIKGQGDSVELLRERIKSYPDSKMIFGGTPTIKHHSRVETAYRNSDRRKFWVPCHHCGKTHTLVWENVIWDEDPMRDDEIFGAALPDTARYMCPHCGDTWNDREKNLNVRKGEWIAERETRDIAGFAINELYSPFAGSRMNKLVEKYLKAMHKKDRGDESAIIAFTNNTKGEPYEYEDGSIDTETLRDKGQLYDELVVPAGGLALTMGIDVQPDRLAVVIRAWGREEESWLVYWGELEAKVGVTDKNDPCWTELSRLIFGRYQHVGGFTLPIAAVAIDSSDGNTNDAVYRYVRDNQNRGVKLMAIKGSSVIEQEIVRTPKKVDLNSTSKAARFGLEVWSIGVNRAKDLISSRLNLPGSGAGRMHFYAGVRGDYADQMTGESKIPSRTQRHKKVWTQKAGQKVEAWDCENYALFCARQQRFHIRKSAKWDEIEAQLKQGDLLSNDAGSENVVSIIDNRPDYPEKVEQAEQTVTVSADKPKGISMKDLGRRMGAGQ